MPSALNTIKNKYFFDHIPKTGGITLRAIFEQILGPENVASMVRGENADLVIQRFDKYQMGVAIFCHKVYVAETFRSPKVEG